MENKNLKCPECGAEMIKKEKYGVEIDKCPNCGGVYLNKGELKRVVENVEEDDGFGAGFCCGLIM